MANHKRKHPKHLRAGCLLCKPWKSKRGGAMHVKGRQGRAWKFRPNERKKVQDDESC